MYLIEICVYLEFCNSIILLMNYSIYFITNVVPIFCFYIFFLGPNCWCSGLTRLAGLRRPYMVPGIKPRSHAGNCFILCTLAHNLVYNQLFWLTFYPFLLIDDSEFFIKTINLPLFINLLFIRLSCVIIMLMDKFLKLIVVMSRTMEDLRVFTE